MESQPPIAFNSHESIWDQWTGFKRLRRRLLSAARHRLVRLDAPPHPHPHLRLRPLRNNAITHDARASDPQSEILRPRKIRLARRHLRTPKPLCRHLKNPARHFPPSPHPEFLQNSPSRFKDNSHDPRSARRPQFQASQNRNTSLFSGDRPLDAASRRRHAISP